MMEENDNVRRCFGRHRMLLKGSIPTTDLSEEFSRVPGFSY